MWSEGNPRTEVGMQSWAAAARQHSVALQKVRGNGPLVSGLMGIDMCCACCQQDISERMSAEQVANHPFIMSCRTWSPEMDMLSDLAPLLRHMPPGDVKGPGSHEWMMTSLPDTHQQDWALELIGSQIKYPFAVEIFVHHASKMKQNYSAKRLVDVLLKTGVRSARCLAPGSKVEERCRAQMAVLDAQGVCRCLGLPRIFQKLGLLKKLTPEAAEALSHRFRGRLRQKNCQRQPHKHAGKKIQFGTSWYVLRHNLKPTAQLLEIVRKHGPAPLQETEATGSGAVTHISKYRDMLRKLPLGLLLHPDHRGPTRKLELAGQIGPKYVSTWVQRKHMCSQLGLRTAWPPAAELDVQWLRSWCPDSKCRLGEYENSMRLNVLEMKAGCPYYELSMWLCLVGPLMQMHVDVRQFVRNPRNFDACIRMIHEHQAKAGIPPTLELLGQSVWRSMVRKTLDGSATGSGAASKKGRKRPAAAEATAEAAAGEQEAAEQGEAGRQEANEEAERQENEEVEEEEEAEAGEEEIAQEEEEEKAEELEKEDEEAKEAEKNGAEKEEAEKEQGKHTVQRKKWKSTLRKQKTNKATASGAFVRKKSKRALLRSNEPISSGDQGTEMTSKKPRHARIDSTGQKGESSAPAKHDGSTVSGDRIFTFAPRIEHSGDVSAWTLDRRLPAGQCAENQGWWRCECNGYCGRYKCPGRQRGYMKTQKKDWIGCPNPALSGTQKKLRCVSCSCQAIGCDNLPNATGFCFQHRTTPTEVLKRPAAASKRPAAACS